MKIAQNDEFLVVDTENDNQPFKRIYVFLKNTNSVKTYCISDLLDNLYSPFDFTLEERISLFCKNNSII